MFACHLDGELTPPEYCRTHSITPLGSPTSAWQASLPGLSGFSRATLFYAAYSHTIITTMLCAPTASSSLDFAHLLLLLFDLQFSLLAQSKPVLRNVTQQ